MCFTTCQAIYTYLSYTVIAITFIFIYISLRWWGGGKTYKITKYIYLHNILLSLESLQTLNSKRVVRSIGI